MPDRDALHVRLMAIRGRLHRDRLEMEALDREIIALGALVGIEDDESAPPPDHPNHPLPRRPAGLS